MKKAAIAAAVFVLSAGIALAETSETKIEKKICEADTVVRKPALGADATGDVFRGSKNFCTNESAQLIVTNDVAVMELRAACICRTQEQLEAVGCGEGQRQPQVTIIMPRAVSGCATDSVTISKCSKDPRAAYLAACKSGTFVLPPPDNNFELASLSTDWAKPLPLLGDANGSEILTQALTQRGMPAEQAQQLVAEQRDSVESYVKALWSGDTEAIKSAGEKLNIDPELLTKMERLQPPPRYDGSGNASADAPDREPRSPATGFGESDTAVGRSITLADSYSGIAQCGVPGIAGKIMYIESGCGRNTVNPINPSVVGPYQYLCSTWQGDTAAIGRPDLSDCANRNDVKISSYVVNARYALHQQTYGPQCAAIGASWDSCAYGIHLFGEGGFRNVLASASANPSAPWSAICGSAVSAQACSNNLPLLGSSGTVKGIFNMFDNRLNGNAIINYAGAGAVRSPFTGFTTATAEVPVYNTASPFASVNPLSNMLLLQALSQRANPQQTQQPTYNPYQYAPPQMTTSPPITVVSSSTAPVSATPAQASATLIAQPHTVSVGGSVNVSWSSVGMSTAVPCTLAANNEQLARANSGTKAVATKTAGTVTFTLSCIGPSGTVITKTDSVTVQ